MVLIDLMPEDTPESMTSAWMGCMHWALGREDLIQHFDQDSGQNLLACDLSGYPMESPEEVIDSPVVQAFILWINANFWGPCDVSPFDEEYSN
jgi:hypothetical protein